MKSNRFAAWLREYDLYLAWVVSLTAVAGSLYFSEVAGFIPCELCWFQRIMMYPLVLILGVASFKNDRSVIPYVLVLSIIGGSISIYHYLQQKVSFFASISTCSEGVPCSGEYINVFGFVTIPFLALVAFILITCLLWPGRRQNTL
ncbi:MAG: disulfide bond formation protein B [Bacillaceae bacterium]|nr:disulfide bond formation protein B [Bacillaceae bacterium]